MKSKILLLLGVVFTSVTISIGQISPGKFLLGGSISYNSNKNTQSLQQNLPSHYSNLSSSIQLGKFIRENTAAGFFLSYSYNKNSIQNNPDAINSYYNAGIFYKKYKTLARNFYFFGEGDVSYTNSKNTQVEYQTPNIINTAVSNGGSMSFTPGISYGIWKKLQMELLIPNIFSINYAHVDTKDSNNNLTDKGNLFSANANLNSNLLYNFAVGFKFFL